MDFSLIRKAGITDQEVAKMLGVSQVTVWKYRTGNAAPKRGDLGRRTEVLLYVLERLLEKGALPKPELDFHPRMDPELKERRAAVVAKIGALVSDRIARQ